MDRIGKVMRTKFTEKIMNDDQNRSVRLTNTNRCNITTKEFIAEATDEIGLKANI